MASTCPNGTGCVYVHINYSGAEGIIPFSGFGGGGCHRLNSTFNNKVSSADNWYGSGEILILYDNNDCTGDRVVVENDDGVNFRWGFDGTWFNDRASSFRIV
jgi:hypothetical protein